MYKKDALNYLLCRKTPSKPQQQQQQQFLIVLVRAAKQNEISCARACALGVA